MPGVFSQGATLQELEENIRDAYLLVIKDEEEELLNHSEIKNNLCDII